MSDARVGRGSRWTQILLAAGVLLLLAVAQELAARAATGLGAKVLGGVAVTALQGLMTLFLVVVGLQIVARRFTTGTWQEQVGLVRRSSAAREWSLGVAVAWGAVVLSVLPLVLFRSMQVTFWLGWRGWVATLCSVVGIAATSLAVEMVYRGFAFLQLSKGLNRASSAMILILIYGVVYGRQGPRGLLVSCALATLFLTGWLRTHAVWMSWGLHLGWAVSLGLIFGLPLADVGDLSGVVSAQVRHGFLRFPAVGPSGMVWTLVVLLGAIFALVWVTKEYAWRYTHPTIVAGGFPMDPAPPPAHAAMEASASSAAAPLVQIAGSAPRIRSDVGITKEDSV